MARRYLVGAKGARFLAIGAGAILKNVRPCNTIKSKRASAEVGHITRCRVSNESRQAGAIARSRGCEVAPKIHGTTRHEEGPTTNALSPWCVSSTIAVS